MVPSLLLQPHATAAALAAGDGFLPHGFCYLWNKPLLLTHLVSDLVIGASYVVISFALAALVHRARRDIPFSVIFVAFGLFIITCGMTHFMEVWTLWRPAYWLSGGVKAVTAIASAATAAAMPFMIPRVHATIRDAKSAREREVAAARAAALEEQNARLAAQAEELARQREEARTLAAQLERANAELRRVAAEAQRHLDELEATYRSAPVGLAVLDRELRFVRINERLAALNGVPAAAHVGRTVREVVPGVADDAEPVLRRVLDTGEPVLGFELTGETPADPGVEHVWVESWIPLRDASGAIAGINVVTQDVTERRRAEAAREASEARWRALVEAAPMIAWSGDDRGAIVLANASWADYTGQSAEASVGRFWGEVVHPEDRARVQAVRERAIATGEAIELEARFRRADGAYRWHLTRVVPVAAGGRVFAWYGAAVDIDDRKREAADLARTVDELQRANARLERLAEDFRLANEELAAAHVQASAARVMAEQASAAKTQFLATMSHELRTPLNAVVGYVGLLELEIVGPLTEGQRGYLARVTTSARHLLGLIDEVLDLSKVEAGQMTVSPRPVSARAEGDSALALVRPQAEAKGVAVTLETPAEAGGPGHEPGDVQLLADPDRVRQILVNLLGNAIKFTGPGGHVTLRAQVASGSLPPALHGPGRWACIGVSDTGIGIPADRLEAIFEPFVQVAGDRQSAYARQHGGTGLGLAISRRLSRLMGGELTVTSEPGRGSTFTLWLPVALTTGAVLARRPTPVNGIGVLRPRPRADTPAPAGAETDLGRLLTARAVEITDALVARMRGDSAIPQARQASRVDLEDHVTTFLADLGQALTILDAPDGDRLQLLADGTALRHLIVHRHGRQRARLGWTEAALRREFAILREEIAHAAEAGARTASLAPSTPLDEVVALVDVLLQEAERISVADLGRATASAEVDRAPDPPLDAAGDIETSS